MEVVEEQVKKMTLGGKRNVTETTSTPVLPDAPTHKVDQSKVDEDPSGESEGSDYEEPKAKVRSTRVTKTLKSVSNQTHRKNRKKQLDGYNGIISEIFNGELEPDVSTQERAHSVITRKCENIDTFEIQTLTSALQARLCAHYDTFNDVNVSIDIFDDVTREKLQEHIEHVRTLHYKEACDFLDYLKKQVELTEKYINHYGMSAVCDEFLLQSLHSILADRIKKTKNTRVMKNSIFNKACECDSNSDLRARCMPSDAGWGTCPMKLESLYELLYMHHTFDACNDFENVDLVTLYGLNDGEIETLRGKVKEY